MEIALSLVLLMGGLALAPVASDPRRLLARRRHDRVSAPVLMGLYALSYAILIAAD